MQTTIKEFEATAFAMITFINEYNNLHFISDKIIRFDTAKKNFKDIFLNRCNCELCKMNINQILNIQFIHE
jgi:hypothetical protein